MDKAFDKYEQIDRKTKNNVMLQFCLIFSSPKNYCSIFNVTISALTRVSLSILESNHMRELSDILSHLLDNNQDICLV